MVGSRSRRQRSPFDHVVDTPKGLHYDDNVSKAILFHGKPLQEHAIFGYYHVDAGLASLSFNRD